MQSIVARQEEIRAWASGSEASVARLLCSNHAKCQLKKSGHSGQNPRLGHFERNGGFLVNPSHGATLGLS